ncbi:SCF E3 ubiquitin ligase complex F-box protein grrA [Paracoccidioides brasiliensis Pb03]|nr:SCF E3 ubiquitin ligase complex F-box protein grrA [Paracoccidioides brasiliensis Pb03]
MLRSRAPLRVSGDEALSESSNSTSPERAADDDTDFFMHLANDSESSVGMGTFRDLNVKTNQNTVLPPISRLPPELLISIFAKLNSPTDMLSCMQVSRSWAVNCVGILWHRPSCNTWENLEKVVKVFKETNSYFHYYDLVKRLNLSALSNKISDGSVVPFASCKRIERLTLTNCSMLTDNGVSDLVEGNKHLQALDVSELKSLTDHTLLIVAKNCPRLQGLNITGCAKVTDESLIAIAKSCRQIKRLKLNGVTQVTDRSIQAFSANCPSMLEIDLHGCRQVTSSSVTALLSTLRNLRELRLAQCVEIENSAFLNLPDGLIFDSLRILDLTACENLRDDAIHKIINSAPRLRNLVLAKCRFITDRSVFSICKLGKNIHYVHLGHCSNITDAAVIQLVKSCNRIRYIDLACCNRLTDTSIQQLATLPKLRRIGLVKCQSITDRSILALAKSRVSQHPSGTSCLERVHLSYCIHLTMEGIHSLLNNCPRLTHLSLTGVQAFLREDLTAFCREAPVEFTQQQRDVFCVFSGEGVSRLRDFLNRAAVTYRQETVEGTMYDDADELDEEEGQVTGLMHATVINDEEDNEMADGVTATPPLD